MGVASDAIGSGPGVTSSLTVDMGVVAGVDTFCFFLGCGSTVEETLCLERTGTGIVVRGFPRPDTGTWVSRRWVRIRHVSGVVNANKVG